MNYNSFVFQQIFDSLTMTGFGFSAPTSTAFGIGVNTQTTASPFGNNSFESLFLIKQIF